mmetsp:Transcript_43672/g.103071  ORF Transcript_43672/g.103071 Transcript_43672/m.103071 type:complete len:203 (+) Transcript_43672:140-748(+)
MRRGPVTMALARLASMARCVSEGEGASCDGHGCWRDGATNPACPLRAAVGGRFVAVVAACIGTTLRGAGAGASAATSFWAPAAGAGMAELPTAAPEMDGILADAAGGQCACKASGPGLKPFRRWPSTAGGAGQAEEAAAAVASSAPAMDEGGSDGGQQLCSPGGRGPVVNGSGAPLATGHAAWVSGGASPRQAHRPAPRTPS